MISASAFGAARLVEGTIKPLVIDITHAVPVELSAPAELDNGDILTVTAPITVSVELRVSVDGQGVATVIEDAAQEPEITITDVVVPADAAEVGDLIWRVVSVENLGESFAWDSYHSYTTSGNFIRVMSEVENKGDSPISLSPHGDGIETALIDERGRQFAEMDYGVQFNELCRYTAINPGLVASCVMVFDVAKDVDVLALRLAADDTLVEIPLAAQEPDQEQVDDLGIPYHLEMDFPDIEITEWAVFADTNNQFNIAGEIALTDDAEGFQDVVAEVSFYNSSDQLIERDDISGVDFRLDVDGYSRFNSRFTIFVEEIDHYVVNFKIIR